jgi:RNA polymerase sigma factor FliA
VLNPDERNVLIVECQGLVRSIAWKIHRKLPRSVDLDDLIAYGNVGLASAAQHFDPSRGFSFTTYAYYRIRGAILDGLNQMTWFQPADYHRGRYERLADDLVGEDQEADTAVSGTADWASAYWLHDVCEKLTVSRLLIQSNETVSQVADEDGDSPYARIVLQDTIDLLHRLVDALPPAEKQLITATYFQGLTLKEAGERAGKSKSWASRLHAKTLSKLASGMRALAPDESR